MPSTSLTELDEPTPAASREGRFLPWLWIAVGALLIAGVVSAFVIEEEPTGAERLAAAAGALDDAGSFAYELTMDASGPFASTFSITGDIDPEAERSTSSIQVPGTTIQLIADRDVLYVQVPEGARDRFGGRPWARVPADAFTSGMGGVAPSASPLQTFEQLREAGEVEEIGKEPVRGTATTHYRTVVDMSGSVPEGPGTAEVRDALKAVTVDVWLDGDDRIRRHRTSLDLAGIAGAGATFSLVTTIETFDFGKAVTIEVPPADQVADMGDGGLESLFAPAAGSSTD